MANVKTTISISPEAHQAIKIQSAIASRNMSSVIEEAFWSWAEDKGGSDLRERRIARLVEAAT